MALYEVYKVVGTVFGQPQYMGCGCFQTQRGAEALVEELKASGFDAYWGQVQ